MVYGKHPSGVFYQVESQEGLKRHKSAAVELDGHNVEVESQEGLKRKGHVSQRRVGGVLR